MRNGWYRESYRHSLAARGISTSKRMSFMPVDLSDFGPTQKGHNKGRFIEELGQRQRDNQLEEQQKLKNLIREDYQVWVDEFKTRYPEWDVHVQNIDASSNDIYGRGDRYGYGRNGRKMIDVFFDGDGNMFISNNSLAEVGSFSLPGPYTEGFDSSGVRGSYGYDFKPGDYPEITSIDKGHWTSNEGVARAFARGEIAQSQHMFSEGDAVFSYGHHFPIAVRLPDGTILWNKEHYSSTTARHQGEVRSALGWKNNKIDVESNLIESLAKANPPGATKIDDVDTNKVAAKFMYEYKELDSKYPGITEKIGQRYKDKAGKDLSRMKYELEMLQSMVQNSLKNKEQISVEQLYPKVYNRYGHPIDNLRRLQSGRVFDINLSSKDEVQQ